MSTKFFNIKKRMTELFIFIKYNTYISSFHAFYLFYKVKKGIFLIL